ncbi:SPOSA6832_03182 [Sporobolomyces salmonicolor]|uniref:Aminopeptidase n=1 Tax=Sporidiobolus salmonicolor TaxID=5005 RepID=A0A0D6ENB3_SPOSA|nr:SPOSA6832_03182 [Sporobolomyces salmonicolor]
MSPAEQIDNRLPRAVLPSHYDVTIRTDLRNLSFSGVAEIHVSVSEPVQSIVLNVAAPLKLEAAVIGSTSLKTESLRPVVSLALDEKRERVEIKFAGGEIAKGEHRLGLRWKGVMDTSMMGYYRSVYPLKGGKEGEKAYYGLTQFEPCQARRAFPCFDEPNIKATFGLSLLSRVGTTSLANTNVESTHYVGKGGDFPRSELLTDSFFAESQSVEVIHAAKTEGKTEGETAVKEDDTISAGTFADDWELVKFAPTPKMSTYLVAWANGDFEHIEGSYTSPLTKRKVPMRVYATHDHIAQAGLALETKERILPIYEQMFDIPYPLPKLDTLAMENWGLITGRTSVYLYDPKKSGIAAKKHVIGVQSHEVAHQCVHPAGKKRRDRADLPALLCQIEPDWKIHSSFISDHLARALQLDALRSSHPIEMPCPDEDTIQQIFDAVSYSKGASCLKMLSNFVGEKTFLQGVSTYLKRHLYGNARTADLFKGISEAYGKDISEMMKNWTTKIGFPLITVEETDKGIKIRQNRFLSTGDATPEEDQTIWHVPLEPLVVDGGKKAVQHGVVLTERESTLDIKDVKNTTYKLNAETCDRVLYPADRLAKIGDEAGKADSAFSLNDRFVFLSSGIPPSFLTLLCACSMGLVQDASVLASSGYAKTSSALTLISKMANEKENLVWAEISSALGSLSATWWDQPKEVRDAISKFRRTLFGPVVDRLGFEYKEDDDVDTIELRTLAISTAAVCGDEATLKEYKRRFGLLLEKGDESQIPSDLRTSIYSQSVRFGGEAEYAKILEIYNAPPTPAHKSSAMVALCSSEKPELLEKTFAMLLSGEVKNQDFGQFFASLSRNRASKRQLWDFLQHNYAEILQRFKGPRRVPLLSPPPFCSLRWTLTSPDRPGNYTTGRLVAASFSGFSSEGDAKAVEAFFADKDKSSYAQPLSQGLDAVRSRAKWLERDVADVEKWLRENQYL